MVSKQFRFSWLDKVAIRYSQSCETCKVGREMTKRTRNVIVISIPQVKYGGKLMLKALNEGNQCKGIGVHREWIPLDDTSGTVKGKGCASC